MAVDVRLPDNFELSSNQRIWGCRVVEVNLSYHFTAKGNTWLTRRGGTEGVLDEDMDLEE